MQNTTNENVGVISYLDDFVQKVKLSQNQKTQLHFEHYNVLRIIA